MLFLQFSCYKTCFGGQGRCTEITVFFPCSYLNRPCIDRVSTVYRPCIVRVSIVYLSYIYRVSIVVIGWLYVVFTDSIAYSEGIFEEGFGGIEALSPDLRDGTIDFHLSVNLVTCAPRGGFFLATEAVRSHADV